MPYPNQSPFGLPEEEPLFQTGDPRDPLNSFARSPWLTMASTAMQNMGQMRQTGAGPAGNPIAAYQQAVSQQSLMNQRTRQNQLAQKNSQLGIQQKEQAMNPFYAYEEAKARGHIPSTTTYTEWTQLATKGFDSTSPIKNLARRDQLQSELDGATTPEAKQEAKERLDIFDNYVRARQIVSGGGGSQYGVGPGGQPEVLIDAPTATGREGTLAGTKESAKEQAQTREGQVRTGLEGAQGARAAYQAASTMNQKSQEWLEQFDSPNPPETGIVAGTMLRMFGLGDEQLGDLNAETINAALLNLGITNLAPVTEQEFAAVMQMWADISNSPEVNKGSLQNAVRRTERLMQRVESDAIYNAGLVEEYGTESQYGAFLRSNPFVGDLLTPTEDDPEIP